MNMKRMIAASACALLATFGFLSAEDTRKEDVSLSDVVIALEKIEARLSKAEEKDITTYNDGRGMGGGPRFDVRYFLDMGKMNSYLSGRGDYAAFDSVFYPFSNSGGGTWRMNMGKNWQMGWNAWGGGTSSTGFQKNNAYDTIDKNLDGKDDYYSHASYGISVNDFVLQYKVALVDEFLFAGIGGLCGIAREGFGIERNQRSFADAAIAAFTGEFGWNRWLFDTGAYLTLQVQPFKQAGWFKVSLNGGFDYPIPLGSWSPSAGTHNSEVAPPSDFSPMSAWFGIGMDFNI